MATDLVRADAAKMVALTTANQRVATETLRTKGHPLREPQAPDAPSSLRWLCRTAAVGAALMIDSEAAIVAAETMVPADTTAAVAVQRTCEEQQMQLAGSARKSPRCAVVVGA